MLGIQDSNQKIVTNELVLHLDAAQRRSYPTTGSTWTDLSGKGNNVTLINSPTYQSTNGGNIYFDGTFDGEAADFSVGTLGTEITVEFFAKLVTPSNQGYDIIFGFYIYNLAFSTTLVYNTGASDGYGIPSAQFTSLGLGNNWKHYACIMRSDVSYANNKIYVNGVDQTLSQISGNQNASNRNFNSGNGSISSWRARYDGSTPFNGAQELAIFRIYNRGLSATEVLQNYNATKSRFGL
jgi:hypothetical protein